MADNPGDEVLKSIKDNVTPAGAGQKLKSMDPMPLLKMLQQLTQRNQPQQAPGLNEQLPRYGGLDERGNPIIIPGSGGQNRQVPQK